MVQWIRLRGRVKSGIAGRRDGGMWWGWWLLLLSLANPESIPDCIIDPFGKLWKVFPELAKLVLILLVTSSHLPPTQLAFC